MATAIASRPPAPPAERLRSVLSYSEQLALQHILRSIRGPEAIISSATIADQHGLTRSTMNGALRLAQAAGLVETKSLGTKGTRILILDRPALEAAVRE